MKSLWKDAEAQAAANDPLQLRVYTSRLLGQDPSLVLHGGGNTSVKVRGETFLGDIEDICYVKGSGWDLGTIEAEGFAPVRMDVLLKLAAMEDVSDTVIVREQRAGLVDPYAPNPSVEAILHAVIPFKYVDHTHADAIVAISNTARGREHLEAIYGERVLILPYVMPGFTLARQVYNATRDIDWSSIDGIILMHHGVFTFSDDARESYETHIELVSIAEEFLESRGAFDAVTIAKHTNPPDLLALSRLRQIVSKAAGRPMYASLDASPESQGFAARPDVVSLVAKGPLTPDHVSRTKRTPAVIENGFEEAIDAYIRDYRAYFQRYDDGTLVMLDPAPRWVVWPGQGIVSFGATVKMSNTVADMVRHTLRAIQWAEALDGWAPTSEDHFFDMEYWELQQAKHKRAGKHPPLQGKIALVTDATCAEALRAADAAVASADPETVVARYGGLDIVVTDDEAVARHSLPYLRHGIDPVVILLGTHDALGETLQAEGIRVAILETADRLAAAIAALASDAFAGSEKIVVR